MEVYYGKGNFICEPKRRRGKTTSTFNFAACLAQRGYRVLMVDVDPEAKFDNLCRFGAV